MSGSGGYRIPAEFDFGNSAERAQQLETIFRTLISQANQLSSTFDKAGSSGKASGDKAAQSLLKQLRDALTVLETTARAVQTVSSEVRALNAQGTAARNLSRANREAEVQEVSRRGRVGQQITRAGSVEDLRTIEVALRRDVERLKANRRELARIAQGVQEGDAEDAKKRLTQTARQVRTARDALASLEQRRAELLQVEQATAARQREINNLRRRTAFNQDPEIQALREAERASRPARPGLSFDQRVAASIDRTAVNQEAQARLPAATRQRILDNLRTSQIARQGVRLDLESDPAFAAGGDALAAVGRFRRLRVDTALEGNQEYVQTRERVERQKFITNLQRRIRRAQDDEIQALQGQLDALRGPTGPTLAGTIQRLVLGSQALSQAATDPATRAALLQGNLARADLSMAAQASLYGDAATRQRMLDLRVQGGRLSTDANLSLLGSPADRARMVQLGLARGALNDEVTAARLADEQAQAAAIRRRQAQAQINVRADEGLAPDIQSRRADLARAQSREFLFGDGGGNIFATQARLMVNYTILNQIQTAFTASVQAVVEFDNSLKNLQAISGSTNGEMEKLAKTIQDVSLGTKFSAVELAQAAVTMAQAGLGVGEIGAGLQAVALLATATGSEIGTAVDIATTALSVFRMRAEELPNIANQMTAALNLSKLTIEQVALGFQYVGNAAADAGLSMAETTAALATLANQGIRSGSTLGTGFRQLLVDLQQPNENLSRRMRELGLTMADVDVRANGLSGVFENLRRAGFTSADAFATIELRAAAAFAAFSRGAQDLNEIQQGILNSGDAASANAVQMESLANRFLQLRNTINALVFEASKPFMDLLKSMVTGLNDVLLGANGATVALQLFGGAVTALAVGGVLRLFAGLATSLIAVRTAMIGATAATATLSGALRAVPFVGWVATLGTALSMLVDFGGANARAAADMEKSRQAVNEANSAYERQRSALQSLDEFMSNTIRRTVALNNDQALLNTTIAEARNRFGNLSTAVNENISSYSELIGVLQRVRGELSATLLIQARVRAEATETRVRELETATQAPPNARAWQSLVQGLGGSTDARSPYIRALTEGAATPGITANQLQANATLAAFPQALRSNPEIQRAFDVLGRLGSIPAEEIEPASRVLAQALARLSTTNPEDLGLTRERRDLLANFIQDRTRSLGELAGARAENRVAQSNLRTYAFGASGAGQGVSELITGLDTEITQRLRGISSNAPLEDRQRLLGELRTFAERRVDEIRNLAGAAGPDNPIDDRTGLRVGENYLQTNPAFSSVVARLREAGIELDRNIARATAERAEASLSAAERVVQNVISRARNVNNPEEARRLADEAERSIRGSGQTELERLRARRREEDERNPRDVETRRIVAEEDERGVAARVEQRVREVRNQVTESVVRSIEVQLQEIGAALSVVNQRGRNVDPAERTRLQNQGRDLIQQIGRLRGEDEQTITSRINRFNSGQDRATFQAPPGYSTRTDPRFADQANYDARVRSIERDIRTDRLEAETPARAIRAQLDAARRVPERFSRGSVIQLEQQLNEAEIAAELSIAQSQRRRIEELTALEREVKPRLEEFQRLLAARPDAAAPSTAETRELASRVETLGNVVRQIDDLRRNAEVTIEQTNAIAQARSEETTGSLVDAVRDARLVFEREFGLNDNVFKQFSDNMTQVFGDAQRATAEFFMAFATGSKSTKDAARDLAVNILQSMARIATNRLAAQLLNAGIDLAIGAFGGTRTEITTPAGSPGVMKYNGGPVSPFMRFNSGGRVPGTNIGRDTVRALLAPDEYVVSARGHQLVGTETLDAINRGHLAAVKRAPAQPMRRDPDEVNVYVMAPNERPQLGPKDVLAVIGQDVLTGGSTKQLIRQVAVGAI